MNGSTVTSLTAFGLIYLISIPAICYYSYKFYQFKSYPIMSFRDPVFVVVFNTLIAFELMFDRSIKLITYSPSINIQIPRWISGLLAGICVFGLINLFAIKSYLLFFKQRYHNAIENETWKKDIINPSSINWYISNKNKWGNFKYITKWMLIPYIIIIIIETSNEAIFGYIFMLIFHIIVVFVPILVILILACRLGKFNDIYGIRKEVLGHVLLFLFFSILYFGVTTLESSLMDDYPYEYVDNVGKITASIIVTILFTIIAFSNTFYPLYLLRLYLRRTNVTQRRTKPNNQSKILDVFDDYRLFSLFMRYLIKEFATEGLSFLLECFQIKYEYQLSQDNIIKMSNIIEPINVLTNSQISDNSYMFVDFNINNYDKIPGNPSFLNKISSNKSNSEKTYTETDGTVTIKYTKPKSLKNHKKSRAITYIFGGNKSVKDMIKIKLSKKLPTSHILKSNPNNIKKQFQALYLKYFVEDSNYELNLPYEIKENIKKCFTKELGTMIDGDIWRSMDESCMNVLRLLTPGFYRFKLSDKYLEYINSIQFKTKATKQLEMIDVSSNMNHDHDDKPKIYFNHPYQNLNQKIAKLNVQ